MLPPVELLFVIGPTTTCAAVEAGSLHSPPESASVIVIVVLVGAVTTAEQLVNALLSVTVAPLGTWVLVLLRKVRPIVEPARRAPFALDVKLMVQRAIADVARDVALKVTLVDSALETRVPTLPGDASTESALVWTSSVLAAGWAVGLVMPSMVRVDAAPPATVQVWLGAFASVTVTVRVAVAPLAAHPEKLVPRRMVGVAGTFQVPLVPNTTVIVLPAPSPPPDVGVNPMVHDAIAANANDEGVNVTPVGVEFPITTLLAGEPAAVSVVVVTVKLVLVRLPGPGFVSPAMATVAVVLAGSEQPAGSVIV